MPEKVNWSGSQTIAEGRCGLSCIQNKAKAEPITQTGLKMSQTREIISPGRLGRLDLDAHDPPISRLQNSVHLNVITGAIMKEFCSGIGPCELAGEFAEYEVFDKWTDKIVEAMDPLGGQAEEMSAKPGVDEHQLAHPLGSTRHRSRPPLQSLDEKHLLEQGQIAFGRSGRQAHLRGQTFNLDRLSHRACQPLQEATEIRPTFYLGQLGHVPVNEIVDIRLEKPRSARLGATYRLRKAAAKAALDITLATFGPRSRAVAEPPPVIIEDSIDEPLVNPLQLSLGKGPQLDRLHPADKRVGKATQTEQTG